MGGQKQFQFNTKFKISQEISCTATGICPPKEDPCLPPACPVCRQAGGRQGRQAPLEETRVFEA